MNLRPPRPDEGTTTPPNFLPMLPNGIFWEACACCFGLSSAPGLEPWEPRFVVLLSLVQLEIWAFVTPDVTRSTFQCAFSSSLFQTSL